MRIRVLLLIIVIVLLPSVLRAKESAKKDNQKVIYLDSADNLEETLKRFKGKVVYIDMWGTWCGTCITELNYNQELENFFSKNNIVRLYVAFNVANRKDDAKIWRDIIEKHQPPGYHIYLKNGSPLRTDLLKESGYRLPCYMIANKNGKIVKSKARKPSENKKLVKQLKKYLN